MAPLAYSIGKKGVLARSTETLLRHECQVSRLAGLARLVKVPLAILFKTGESHCFRHPTAITEMKLLRELSPHVLVKKLATFAYTLARTTTFFRINMLTTLHSIKYLPESLRLTPD
jgi:hypothetical protein